MKKVEELTNQAREEWEEQRREELREVKALARESAKTVADNAQRKCLDGFSPGGKVGKGQLSREADAEWTSCQEKRTVPKRRHLRQGRGGKGSGGSGRSCGRSVTVSVVVGGGGGKVFSRDWWRTIDQ